MEVQKMKHVCKFCKKSFPCGRSLGGHIRSHLPKPGYELRENPKKTWRVTTNDHQQDVVIDSTTVSSSSTETENPKTSKMNPNQGKRSNFGRNNNSHSSVSEVVEAEHHQQQEEEVVVAMCLIMLSKDEGSWGKISSSFTTLTESSENNLLHQGKKNMSKRRRREKKQGNVSVSVAGNGKKFESTTCGYLQKGLKLKGIEVSANGFCSNDSKIKSFESKRKREKVVESKKSDFTAVTDDHDAVKCGKVESSASGYGKNGGKINEFEVLGNGFVSNDQNNQTPESKRKFIGQCSGFRNVKKWSKLEEFEVSQNGFSTYDQKNNYNNNNNNNGHSEMDSEFCKTRSKFECTTCNKVFHSYQALGGHRASHKKLMGGGKCSSPMTLPKLEAEIDTDDVDHQSTEEVQQQSKLQSQQKQEMGSSNMVIGSSSSSKKAVQKHECPICYRVFSSGQALGGHKRSHLIIASSPNAEINDRNSEVKMIDKAQNRGIVERLSSSEARDMLDLNFPPAQDETTTTTTNSSSNSLVGFMKPYWCVESSHKHEQLLGLISN